MENTNNLHEMEEEFEDTISLCDLSFDHQDTEPNTSLDQNQDQDREQLNFPSNQDLFEFSTTQDSKTELTVDNIIFCGKIIPYKIEEPTNILYNQRNSLFPLSSADLQLLNQKNRSNSFHMPASKPSLLPRATRSFGNQSSNSRKHMFTIGLARIPIEMKLSDIRKRQSQQAPVSMFPAIVARDKAPVTASNGGGKKTYWGLLRPFRCRSYLTRGLTRAYLGCIPIA